MIHHFDSALADELGLDLAVVATTLGQHQAMLLAEGEGKLRSDADGRTWSRHTVNGLRKVFSWWTEKQIRSRVEKAIESGLLLRAPISGAEFDQASWLSFADEDRFVKSLLRSFTDDDSSPQTVVGHQLPKRADGVAQTGKSLREEDEPVPVSDCGTTVAQTGTSSCPDGQLGLAIPQNEGSGSVKSYKEQIGTSSSCTELQSRHVSAADGDQEADPGGAAGGAGHDTVDSGPVEEASAPRKKGKRSKPAFGPDDWQHKAAMKAIRVLHKHEVLAPYVAKRGSKAVAADWAGTFDRLHRLDGYTQPQIKAVLTWLDDADNWWVSSGALQAFSNKIRVREKGNPSKWDQMYVKAQKTRTTAKAKTVEARAASRNVGTFE